MNFPMDKISSLFEGAYIGIGYSPGLSPGLTTVRNLTNYDSICRNYAAVINSPSIGRKFLIDPINDVKPVVTEQLWVRDVVYPMYSPFTTNKVYRTTETGDTYICISNNAGVLSTVKPIGQSEQNIILSDGYVWRWLYNKTDNLVPVPSLTVPNGDGAGVICGISVTKNAGLPIVDPIVQISDTTGTGTGASFIVQTNNVTDVVTSIACQAGGSNYSNPLVLVCDTFAGSGANITLFCDGLVLGGTPVSLVSFTGGSGYPSEGTTIGVVGNGHGLVLTPTVVDGVITDITVTNPGVGYNYVRAYIFSSPNYVIATCVFEPINGFGYDMLRELSVDTIQVKRVIPATLLPPSINEVSIFEPINNVDTTYRFIHISAIPIQNLEPTDNFTFTIQTTIGGSGTQ